jgi:hypothetical protein
MGEVLVANAPNLMTETLDNRVKCLYAGSTFGIRRHSDG